HRCPLATLKNNCRPLTPAAVVRDASPCNDLPSSLELLSATEVDAMKSSAGKALCVAICLAGGLSCVQPVKAAEYTFGTYLLGASIPMAGFTPPPGFYLSDTVYAYQGSASGNIQFPFGNFTLSGKVKVDFLVNISVLSWITDYKILGGDLGFAATIPF